MGATASQIIAYAKTFLGVPYVWGGTTPSGFDCSGFVQYVFSHFGLTLPRTSIEQASTGMPITVDQVAPGDLIFSDWEHEGHTSHVAMYVGGGNLIEAPETGETVHIIPFDANYQSHVTTVRREDLIGGSTPDGGASNGTSTNTTPWGDFWSQLRALLGLT